MFVMYREIKSVSDDDLFQLLQKQCRWFHNVRVTAGAFLTWKSAYNTALVEKEKTGLALWHWSLTLHRKVLDFFFIKTIQYNPS